MKSVLTATKLAKITVDAAAAEERAEIMAEVLETHSDSDVVMEATNRAQRILDASYEKADINDYVTQQSNLSLDEQSQLKSLLLKYESLFDDSLGKLKGAKASFELKDGETPYHAKPFSVPKIYEALIQKELSQRHHKKVFRLSFNGNGVFF